MILTSGISTIEAVQFGPGVNFCFGPSYSYQMNQKISLTTSVSATYADDDYMQNFYTVNASDSLASGLYQFEAEGGLKDVGVMLIGNYAINQKWGVIALAGYEKLLADAKDSSIVRQEGDDDQFRAGLGISYMF